MIVEKRDDVVVVPTQDSSTSVGMILLIAIIALAVGATAWYFSTAGGNNTYIERTNETHDVAPVTVPQAAPAPQAPAPAPQTIIVPQPAAPAPAAPAPAAPAPQANTDQTQDQ